MSAYATACARCGEEATLPTMAYLLAYVRQHNETCPKEKTDD